MDVTLYSTGCPKCNVLEKKLAEKNIDFEVVSDVDIMQNKGFMTMPMLEVDGKTMDFGSSVRWINEVNA